MKQNRSDSYRFQEVLSQELRSISDLRQDSKGSSLPKTPKINSTVNASESEKAYINAHNANLTGIAFSGGGIRSATFNLGIIQALSKNTIGSTKEKRFSLLSRFDYLSTVSGGGYIGSWLSAWIHRDAKTKNKVANAHFLNEIRDKISSHPGKNIEDPSNQADWKDRSGISGSPTTSGFPPLEHAAVRFLRRYSNYLVPNVGITGDMLALVSISLRNFVLLQLALITAVAALLLGPYVIATLTTMLANSNDVLFAGMPIPELTLGLGVLMLLVILIAFGLQIAKVPTTAKTDETDLSQSSSEPAAHTARLKNASITQAASLVKWSNSTWVGLCVFACWLIGASAPAIGSVAPLSSYLLSGIVTYSVAWAIGYVAYKIRLHFTSKNKLQFKAKYLIRSVLSLLISGAVFGVVSYASALILISDWASAPENIHAMISFGSPALLMAISFVVTIHIGTSGDLFTEMHREWWARIGGFLMYALFIWIAVCGISFYSAPFVRWLGNGGLAVILAWAGASGTGAWLARSAIASSNENKKSLAKSLIIGIAPWVFLIGMGVLVSWILNSIIVTVHGSGQSWVGNMSFHQAVSLSTLEFQQFEFLKTSAILVIALVSFLFITWGLDINIFSAHAMYKNRLVRAYLGASRTLTRRPHPFTGFDLGDDLSLTSLAQQRPLHIINTTMNMTGGDDLAWQTRRAASFTFTPQFVGYETKNSHGIDLGGYRLTSQYSTDNDPDKVPRTEVRQNDKHQSSNEGLSLGTALSISGAAASPNMGYHTSPPIAALLTAFNLRLGYWAGNPSSTPQGQNPKFWTAWWRKSPFLAARPILAELTGSATGASDWINLTDGGHFDNLGVYELIRRRCRLIIVTDAGCDPEHRFEDLANTTRKCWTDFGVHIYFPNLDEVALQEDGNRYAEKHGTLGLIEYPDCAEGSPERFGLMLYLKCSLTSIESNNFVDLRQYASVNESFPHQTTGDQFFDEDQFEAYRHLGFCVADQYLDTIRKLFDPDTGTLKPDEVLREASDIWEQQTSSEHVSE